MDPFETHAYVTIIPTIKFSLLGKKIESASTIRDMYKRANDTNKLEIIKELYPTGNVNDIRKIFDTSLENVKEQWAFNPTTVVETIVKTDKGYVLYSKSKKTGRRRKLGGPYPTHTQAVKREKQVQYFKHISEIITEAQDDNMRDIPEKVKEAAQEGLDLVKEFKRGASTAEIGRAHV